MTTDPSRVLVEEGLCSRCSVPTKAVHHRHFPEIRAECGSLMEGARHLANHLAFYREGAQSAWHREELDQALADVAEFLDSLEPSSETPACCRCTACVSGTWEPSASGDRTSS